MIGTEFDLTHIRAVRLWHWERVVAATGALGDNNQRTQSAKEWWDRQRSFHLGCVQALNDIFPIGDTAERYLEAKNAG
jgi:hypothetical protein